jgi:hypothetical protein
MFRIIVRKMLLSKAYLEQRKKSFPVFAVFVEKYLEENYPGWYEYLSKSACPVCGTLIPVPRQLYFHLTYFTRCSRAVDEIVDEIMNEYDRFYRGVCKRFYHDHKEQLLAWLSSYGVSGTAQLCKESARTKNAA